MSLPLLGRIKDLMEASVRIQLAHLCDRELTEPKLRELYDATGEATVNQLARKLRMSQHTICAKWKRWEHLGMLTKNGQSYRKVV